MDCPIPKRIDGVRWFLLATLFACGVRAHAQGSPPSSTSVYQPRGLQSLEQGPSARPREAVHLEAEKTYTLSDLIDVAELHNPETRVAWQQAKARADALGIARSAWYPTISAVALAVSLRTATLVDEHFQRQSEAVFEPVLRVEYLVFDVGGRTGEIDAAKAELLAADLHFNDTHRLVIDEVASSYYRLLNAQGQRDAAEVSLENAKTVEEDAGERLANGLATKPDQLEATAARAQAEYDLQSAVGAVEIARGDLATVLGADPDAGFKVEGIDELKLPTQVAASVNEEIERAFRQRPDLLQQLARLRADDASIKQARSTYFPELNFKGDGGEARAYGQTNLYPGGYASGEVWNVGLELKWTLFDGARREYRIAQAKADKRTTQAEIDALRDQIANEVWAAYSNMRTALRQQQAAASLLTASQQSYEAAHESYGYGVRNLLDVVSAQKTLASARSQDIAARTQLLLQVTNVAFRTGDLIQAQHWTPVP
jgi:outer membrane protein